MSALLFSSPPAFVRVMPGFGWSLLPASLHILLAALPGSYGIGIPRDALLQIGGGVDGGEGGEGAGPAARAGGDTSDEGVRGIKHVLAPPHPHIVIGSGRTTAPVRKRAFASHPA